jgi:hypothetical protein
VLSTRVTVDFVASLPVTKLELTLPRENSLPFLRPLLHELSELFPASALLGRYSRFNHSSVTHKSTNSYSGDVTSQTCRSPVRTPKLWCGRERRTEFDRRREIIETANLEVVDING